MDDEVLRSKYETVEIEFIAHHTEAKVVTEEEFLQRAKVVEPFVLQLIKALELIQDKYHPSRNIYPVHFSDGENISMDNEKCLKLVGELMDVSSMFGYGEVNQHNRFSTLMYTYKN